MAREIVSDQEILGGEPFLEDTRIRVSDIAVKYEELGYTVDEICKAYERLDVEDIEAALDYFYSNRNSFISGLKGETA